MDTVLLIIVVLAIAYFLYTFYGSIQFMLVCKYVNLDFIFDLEESKIDDILRHKYREKALLIIYSLKNYTEKYFDGKVSDEISEIIEHIRSSKDIPIFGNGFKIIFSEETTVGEFKKAGRKLEREWHQYIKMSSIAKKFILKGTK